LRHVNKSYNDVQVLNNCSQSFSTGITAITGPSLCGKSTLLRVCALLEPPTSGKVSYFYKSDSSASLSITLIRKVTLVLPYGTMFNTTAWKNVTSGLKIRRMKRKTVKKLASEMLEKFGLYEKRKLNAFSLTRGECRRLLLARAMVFDPDVLLLDEPTRGLDNKSAEIIENVLGELTKSLDMPTIIMTTTDNELAKRLTDRILKMKDGTFIITKPTTTQDLEQGERIMVEGEGEQQEESPYFVNPKFFDPDAL
jgi:tungstate transport system ATP-binding protein